MEPNLLVGDRLFVTKYSYGYSKHSFPFSPPLFEGRLIFSEPERGDVVVFKTPADNRTDYIKRLIGLPGDKIQFIDTNLYINNTEILKSRISKKDMIFCGKKNIDVLINLIKDKIKSRFLGSENVLITRARHRENLEDCLKNLKKFKNKKDINDFDKAAEDLRLATRSLGKITGKVDVEEILDSIFNDFCIGK